MNNENNCHIFYKDDCKKHYTQTKHWCSSCFKRYCMVSFDPKKPTKEQLERLGIYDSCKFCGGSLEYKSCGHTYSYKSTCKSCKEKRKEYYKKKWYENKISQQRNKYERSTSK